MIFHLDFLSLLKRGQFVSVGQYWHISKKYKTKDSYEIDRRIKMFDLFNNV